MSEQRDAEVTGWLEAVPRDEARDAAGERVLRLAGYAVVFDSPSERMGSFVETIDRRAFDEVLRDEPDVRFLVQHDGLALARTSNGTLRLVADDQGLRFEADLNPEVQAARDLHSLVERGDVTQMSFGFRIGGEKVDQDAEPIRVHVTRVSRLYEISAVTFPAYEATSVDARDVHSVDEVDEASLQQEFERLRLRIV
jgi:HK97 family phage prohead protease